jgi:ribonuclease HII
VALGPGFPIELLDDSKRLSGKARARALARILAEARAYGVGWAWPHEIDAINILRASLLAMGRAYRAMGLDCDLAWVDGLFSPEIGIETRPLPRADSTIPEVMAASILAKEARDRWMARWDWIHPGWGYEKHKGYPTEEHRRALARLGPSPLQRLSFAWKRPG